MPATNKKRDNHRRKVIKMVKEYPTLWYTTKNNRIKNPIKAAAWDKISERMGLPAAKVKHTWEILRAQYIFNFRHYGSDSTWKFFADMDFLREIIFKEDSEEEENRLSDNAERAEELPKVDGSMRPTVLEASNNSERTSYFTPPIEDMEFLSNPEISHSPTPSIPQIKPQSQLNMNDADYYFVMSLLPFLKQIHPNRKFRVRNGIMSAIAKTMPM